MFSLVMKFFGEKRTDPQTGNITIKSTTKDKPIIIGAGFGRTGTSSLQSGLHELGFKCYHMKETSKKKNDLHLKYWMVLCEEKIRLKKQHNVISFENWNLTTLDNEKYGMYFDEILDKNDFNASCDFPSSLFYLELIEYYKQKSMDYKIILTVRDNSEKWHTSFTNTIGQFEGLFDKWFWKLLGKPYQHSKFAQIMFKLIFDENNSKNRSKENVMNKYDLWIESVKKTVDKDKLLIFNVKSGWKPICNFLKMEIPQKYANKPDEFIRTNESKEIKTIINRIKMFNLCTDIVVAVIVLAAVGFVCVNVF